MARGIITWIVVADGARVRVFVNRGVGKGIDELTGPPFTGTRARSGELVSDRPGRTFDRAGPGRHAKEPHSDPHEQAEIAFLRGVAVWLAQQNQSGAFTRLVIVAAPRALGTLRQLLPKPVGEKVTAEISADLTNAPPRRIERRLEDVLAV